MRTKKPKTYPLADALIAILKKKGNQLNGELYFVYLHLFSVLDLDVLNNHLESYKEVWAGKDPYFKKSGKKEWFYVFHKAIRQCDFFTGAVFKSKLEIMTEEEIKEHRYLNSIVHEDGYVKESTDGKSLFNDEYRRYLQLSELRRAENRDRSIGGHLDMILWHTIHLDRKNELKKIIEMVFNPQVVEMVNEQER